MTEKIQQEISSEPKIEHELLDRSILELEKPIEHLLEELREYIERGDFDTLIGDDASGRIPALIVGEAINGIYEKKGYRHLDIRFIAGSRGLESRTKQQQSKKREATRKYLESLYAQKEKATGAIKRTLVVTDTIETGSSLVPLTEVLRQLGIPYDIAAIGLMTASDDLEAEKENLEERLGGKIYYGMLHQAPYIYGQIHKAGVHKLAYELFSYTNAQAEEEALRETVNRARADAKIAAQHIVERYISETQ